MKFHFFKASIFLKRKHKHIRNVFRLKKKNKIKLQLKI